MPANEAELTVPDHHPEQIAQFFPLTPNDNIFGHFVLMMQLFGVRKNA